MPVEVVLGDGALGPVVVGAVGEDEFDFVELGEVPEVGVTVILDLATAGTFEVDDFDNARIDGRDVECAVGFKKDSLAKIAEAR